jgi:hypothetical protein
MLPIETRWPRIFIDRPPSVAPEQERRNIFGITCSKLLPVPVKPGSPRDWESAIH